MALPTVVTLVEKEPLTPFLIPILLLLLVGLPLSMHKPKRTALFARDGFVIVAFAWIVMSLFGCLPFLLSGGIPNFFDAFFETVSGFTTTGATILTEVETLSRGVMFWRCFTHWIGGMGVLVFIMAVLPMHDGHGMHIMRAEQPGPSVGKLVSRMSDTAQILYGIYFVLTLVLILLFLFGGMSFYDACVHAFSTAGTGGFSSHSSSIGAYNSIYIEVITGVFMLLFGVNFNLFYYLLIRRYKDVFRSEELRVYVSVVAISIVAIALNITRMYGSFFAGLRHAFFHVSSIITTTGFATVDYNLWPSFSRIILVIIMFMGACAGSTGGGMKVARFIILAKTSYHDMRRMLHPHAVSTVRFEGKPLQDKLLRTTHLYLTVYIMVFVPSLLLLSLEGFDLTTTITALVACINNIGPGLNLVGPMGSFAPFSGASKLLLSFTMLIGRLEIFPILLLFSPSIWKHRRSTKKSNL